MVYSPLEFIVNYNLQYEALRSGWSDRKDLHLSSEKGVHLNEGQLGMKSYLSTKNSDPLSQINDYGIYLLAH